MELKNEFTVGASVEEAWLLLTDIERIAPCVPGFQLKASSNGEYRGTLKVKVGAVQTTYDCVIHFVERDDTAHRAVISARGRETRGQGGVTADIISTLTSEGEKTRTSVVTKLNVTGRAAQFGRGILSDVSDRLVKQFVRQLESQFLATNADADTGSETAPDGRTTGGATSPRPNPASTPSEPSPEALDLLSVAGGPLIKRIAPVVAILVLAALVFGRLRSRRNR